MHRGGDTHRYWVTMEEEGDKSVDNSQHRHEVNLSVSPGCTVFSISVSVHALTVKQRLALVQASYM